uniref:Uncharacterized protein n=1 Tax=Arundo donax TaxID=35708 RepID=A0A0A9DIR3_ARUDO
MCPTMTKLYSYSNSSESRLQVSFSLPGTCSLLLLDPDPSTSSRPLGCWCHSFRSSSSRHHRPQIELKWL